MFHKPKNWIVVGLQCLIYVSSSLAQTPTVPQKADRSFDVEKPSQPIEGHAVPDLVFRREGGFEAGHLQSLLAFATLYDDRDILDQKSTPASEPGGKSSTQDDRDSAANEKLPAFKAIRKKEEIPGRRIPREEISLILMDGKQLPAKPPSMPPDEDSVLLDSGEVLSGLVMVTRDQVYVAGKATPIQQVTMIRLTVEEKVAPIPAQPRETKEENEEADNGQLVELSPFWVGTCFYSHRSHHNSDEPSCQGLAGTMQYCKWRMAFFEHQRLNEDSQHSTTPLTIRFNREADHGTANAFVETTFYMDWGHYRFENHETHPCWIFKPDPFVVEGLYKFTKNDLSREPAHPDIGVAAYHSKDTEEILSEIENTSGEVPVNWGRSGRYTFSPPTMSGDEQGWRERQITDTRSPNSPWEDSGFACNSFSTGGPSGGPSPGFFHLMSDDYQRISGSTQYSERFKRNVNLWVEVTAEWNFKRVTALPPKPDGNAKQREDAREDCDHYRKQAQEYDSIQQNNSKLIQELADEIRETKDRLIDLGWTERNHGVNPLDHWLWKGSDSWVAYMSVRKYAPDFEPPFDWSEAEKASFNKLKRLRHAQNELFRSNYEAQMNEVYYREAAKDCERDKANVTGPESSPTPQRDPEFRTKALGDY